MASETIGIRKTTVQISINGTNVTAALSPFLMGMEHADDIERNADTLTIRLNNSDLRFLQNWSVDKGSEISASILQWNWAGLGEGLKIECGTFYVDKIDYEGPPHVCIVRATSIPVAGAFKNKRNHSFENQTLKGIFEKLAKDSGLSGVDYKAKYNPTLKRVDGDEESPAYLIKRLAAKNGLAVKVQNKTLIVFDEAEYDQQAPWIRMTLGVSPMIHYQLSTTAQKKVGSMLSSYMNPETGQVSNDEFTPETPPEGVDGQDQEYDRPDYTGGEF